MCILHVGEGKSDGSITLFTDETLTKCEDILIIRKTQKLKYSDIVMPDSAGGESGFHIECYRRFTALSKVQREKMQVEQKEKNSADSSSYLTRSNIGGPLSSSKTGIFPKECIFCSKKDRKHNKQKQKLIVASTTNFESNVKTYAEWLNDETMLLRIMNEDFVSKEVLYHGICRVEYQNKAKAIKDKEANNLNMERKDSAWHLAREIHKSAFEALTLFLDEVVVGKREVCLMSDVNNHYQVLLSEISGHFDVNLEIETTSQKLEGKLINHYGDKITVAKGKTKRGSLVFSSSIALEEALRSEHNMEGKLERKVKEVAFALRAEIAKAETRKLPENLTIDDIKRGEVAIPDIILQFFHHLIVGPDLRRRHSQAKTRRIHSISQDVIFAATSGRKVPGKHLQIGMAVKSLTGSRKVIDMLNRLGHSVSYTTVEEIETELTFEANKEERITPDGMLLNANMATGVAFDNYDRFVETMTGKNTLHDTVGIAYQICPTRRYENTEPDIVSIKDGQAETATVDNKNVKKRRRTYEARGLEIEPYRKKPKMISKKMLPLDDRRRLLVPNTYKEARICDILWMMDFKSLPETTPMWVGWNSQLFPNTTADMQKVWYLPQINESPTSISVVAETMKRAQRVASECNKKSIAVTYDLAIAKIASQLQAEESPKYDNIFVAFGAFHIEFALLSVIGKYIAESGGPHILNEAQIIASGSLSSFLSGKSYKRSKRIHQMLALSMEILHYQLFLKSKNANEIQNNINRDINEIKNRQKFNEHLLSKETNEVVTSYNEFVERTIKGEHGATAQYWMGYIQMVHLHHEFIR